MHIENCRVLTKMQTLIVFKQTKIQRLKIYILLQFFRAHFKFHFQIELFQVEKPCLTESELVVV